MRVLVVALALTLLAEMAPVHRPAPTATVYPIIVSLDKKAWTTYTTLRSFPLANLADGSLAFPFPVSAPTGVDGHVNYLLTAKNTNLNLSAAASIRAQVSLVVPTGVTLNHDTEVGNTCPPDPEPSTVRIMLWANNKGSGEFDRWWQNPSALTMASGTFVLDAPLAADGSWSSVYGKANNYDAATTAAWTQALAHVSTFALTFGGGCFFGHGVYATGPGATFDLQDYRVQ